MAQRLVSEALRSGREVEGLKRHPAGEVALAEHREHRFEVVIARAAVLAVELLNVDVADQIEMAVYQDVMPVLLVDGVVDVEHGADAGAVDFTDDGSGLFEGEDDVGLVGGQGLDKDRDAAGGGLRRDAGE